MWKTMSEFNLDKFAYQRKRSTFSRGNPHRPCATTSSQCTELNSENNSSESSSNTSNEADSDLELNRDSTSLTDSNFAHTLVNVMEIFPSETRLQLVQDAITCANSLDEAVNSVCDKQTSSSVDCSDNNFECSRKKRKRHCFLEDDEDIDKGTKRSRKFDGDFKDHNKYNSSQCSQAAKAADKDGTGDKSSDQDKNEVICVSDDEIDDSNLVVTVIDCTHNNYHIADESDEEDLSEGEMVTILSFFNDCSLQELTSVPTLSAKKAEKIIKMRPFDSWNDLVSKLNSAKTLSSQLIDKCQSLLEERKVVENLMNKCEDISNRIQDMLNSRLNAEEGDSSNSKSGAVITSQPKILAKSLKLKPYQLTSLNWLVVMHEQELNGILADEMGLGKTVQALAFLAHLCETGEKGPHLIIVPSSTLDNWCRETKKWCPSIELFLYYGSQEERRLMQDEVLDREVKPEIIITTYAIATTSDDRAFLRKLKCHYVVLDEGHMLKNMQSQRYQGLMKVKARRRLLLTGTPLQNNLLELMSLLSFVMPCMFGESVQGIKLLFSNSRMNGASGSNYEKATVAQAKRIMKPFVLRRLKKDVLQQLPAKHDHVIKVVLTDDQRQLYNDSVIKCSKQFKQSDAGSQYSNILMLLRKAANHPLLLRSHYKDDLLLEMAEKYCKDPAHRDSEPDLVFEDMTVMSDFELHCLCREEQRLADHCLSKEILLKSGKFVYLDSLLPSLKEKNCRVLLFSQFTMVMDIIEVYLSDRRHRYLRLDGQTSVVDRQSLIDKYNGDPDIFVFLLSTKAGGLGINLTSANVVILHDVDFNPYNDKQAEDRCHRVGQTRIVTVYRLIAKDTIEEGVLQCAQSKLRLEREMAASDEDDVTTPKDVSELLSQVFNSS